MDKIKILVGLPGCGKTTYAKKLEDNWVRVNRDDLRNMRGKYWIPKQESLITELENECIITTLKEGYDVVLDSTNLNSDRNKNRIKEIKKQIPNLEVEYKHFKTSVEQCIKNDLKRENSVGSEVILNMYSKYYTSRKIEQDTNKPRAIICDIDGTLATRNNRSPFEWKKVGQDTPIEPVVDMINELYDSYNIILMSGRDECCREETEDWLRDNDIDYDQLYMRPENSMEKDSIVKEKLFRDNILNNYYVNFVIDDRKQVKRMWTQLGLFVFDVNQKDEYF